MNTRYEEDIMEERMTTQVQVTVFGNRLLESCAPGG